jgi:pimeloyl-ACP methyl ester carboxylesterase
VTEISEHTIEVEGCRLHVRRAGRGERVALLVHGLGDDHGAFPEPVVQDLAQDHAVVVPDLAGFGRSRAGPRFDFRIDSQVALLEGLLDVGGAPGPAVLIGHSMGGAVCSRLAETRPSRVGAFVNVEGNLCSGDAFISSHAVQAADRGRFFDHWWRFLPGAIQRQSGDGPAIRRYLNALSRTTPEAFLATCRDLHRLTLKGATGASYRGLTIPRVYFLGDHPSGETRAFLTENGLSSTHFAGAPHWLIEHDTDAFLSETRRFLEQTN